MRFLIDEDMPRSLAPALRAADFEVLDIRDLGFRGCSDEHVFQTAQRHTACLITEDMGFANILRFPLGSHCGILIGRFDSRLPSRRVVTEILNAITNLTEESLAGALLIVEVGRYRLRMPGSR